MSSVQIREVRKSYGSTAGAARRQRRHRGWRIRHPCRSVGLRKVDPAAHDRRAGEHHQRPNQDRRQGGQRPGAEGARHRHGVPELRALSADDGCAEHGLCARDGRTSRSRRSRGRWIRRRRSSVCSRCLRASRRQLSGGQRQRVAMGRAIVRDPKVFLFDEPLSNLDAKLRVQMRAEIKALQQRLNTTTVYVTHDQIEAMTMADKIVVMHGGRVEQIGAPLELYDRPANQFVAGFLGSPAMNFIPGTLHADNGPRLELANGASIRIARTAEGGRRPEGRLRHPSGRHSPDRKWRRGETDRRRADWIGNAARHRFCRPGTDLPAARTRQLCSRARM